MLFILKKKPNKENIQNKTIANNIHKIFTIKYLYKILKDLPIDFKENLG